MIFTEVMNKIAIVTIVLISRYSDAYMNITLLYMMGLTPLHCHLVYCDAEVTELYTCKHNENTLSMS